MSETGHVTGGELSAERKHDLAKKVGAAAWGLFFIWIGVVLLQGISGSMAMLGIGVITLAAQATRKYLGLHLETFWVVVGVVFVLGGLWNLAQVELPLFPLLLIAAGAALVLSVLRKTRQD